MTDTTTPELLPCAHCAAGEEHVQSIVNPLEKIHPYQIRCKKCGAATAWHGSYGACCAAWNTRAALGDHQSAPVAPSGETPANTIDLCALADEVEARHMRGMVAASDDIADRIVTALRVASDNLAKLRAQIGEKGADL